MRWLTFDSDVVGPWVTARLGGTWSPTTSRAMGQVVDGELVGGAIVEAFNNRTAISHVAGTSPQWLTKTFTLVFFDYVFNQAGFDVLLGPVDSTNVQALRFDTHLGFRPEAMIAGGGKDGVDLILLTMRRADCRWLKYPLPPALRIWPTHLPLRTDSHGREIKRTVSTGLH